jgi:hypothetical protein
MPERPPKEWFYPVVRKIEKEAPQVDDPKALAGWIWFHHMKASTKKAILKAVKKGRKAKLGIRKITARMLKRYDPDALKVRKGLTKKPKVLSYRDFKAKGLIRILERADGSTFPEFALYPRYSMSKVLLNAGFKEEARGKWVLRTNKFNIFVYI